MGGIITHRSYSIHKLYTNLYGWVWLKLLQLYNYSIHTSNGVVSCPDPILITCHQRHEFSLPVSDGPDPTVPAN